MELISESFFKSIPEEWLRRAFEKELTEEEKALIQALGGPEALRKRFEELLKEQKERHAGGSKWIGTGGVSPFGAYGYNPEGYRIGQNESRNRRAVKVWDKREFANLDENVELNTRNIKLALKRLRVFTREGALEELDLDGTIDKTCRNAGMLEIEMVPVRKNRVKVLIFFDIGGSMDDHIKQCEELFSAAKHEFKHLEYYYFHNCLYETVWKDNRRRGDRIPTYEVFHKYNRDYKVIVVGDAAMSPYEIMAPGGSVEHNNPEAGYVWLERLKENYPDFVWLNPNAEDGWRYFESTKIIQEIFEDRMFPLTIKGLTDAMQALKRGHRAKIKV